jgi:hypothetical protein
MAQGQEGVFAMKKMTVAEMVSLGVAGGALLISIATAWLQYGTRTEFSVAIDVDQENLLTWRYAAQSPDRTYGAIEFESSAKMYFINDGNSPVVVRSINLLILHPGSISNILEPADSLSTGICSSSERGGGTIVDASIKPFIVRGGEVEILDAVFPKLTRLVSARWQPDSDVLACAQFGLIDRNGFHESVAPYWKFDAFGGSPLDRPSRGRPPPYLLLR